MVIRHKPKHLSGNGIGPKIDFQWERPEKGFHLPRPVREMMNLGGDVVLEQETRPVGRGRWLPCRPLDESPLLYRVFSAVKTVPQAIDFASQYGPLTRLGRGGAPGEDLREILEQASQMRFVLLHANDHQMLAMLFKDGGVKLNACGALIEALPHGHGMRVKLSPRSLVDALWLQLALAGDRMDQKKECPHCGTIFGVGPGSGRRLDSKFCSDGCRTAHNSRKRPVNQGRARRRAHA
ncbi:MAG TPA: hypothetical protein VF957_23395 [Bradyrhizobium sp.]